ncbi:PC4-domain-containing protein [Lentinus brumalis]|uniref:PC4-domain-containing protein n=1 Tax=Lentinus brumalis TaxID=2498619 RepID=A0A371CSN0_9APHY|nr:PC4-domain-containing protein [Polyporus brumalis]
MKRKAEVTSIDDDDSNPQHVSESGSPQESRHEVRRRKKVNEAEKHAAAFEDYMAELVKEVNAAVDSSSVKNTGSSIGESSFKDAGTSDAGADEDRDVVYMDLGKKRRATVRIFKRHVYVDIREFYGDSDSLQPGRKGIMLTEEQWEALKDSMEVIDLAVASVKK